MKIQIDKNAKFIIDTLKKHNYKAFVVGGCVRDIIMGLTPKDFDIATSAKPEEVKKLFDKCIDTGIEHGTVTIVINKEMYEVTTFRIDGDYIDNRKPTSVLYTDDIYEDMLRRDFTMNAIGYNEEDGFIDYFDGFKDIENKTIRGVGDPLVRFTEDALRMLRAVRFSATLGFNIEEKTYDAIIQKRELLKNISVERVREELTKLLHSNNTDKIELLVDTKLIKYYNEEFYNYLNDNIESIKSLLNYSKKDNVYLYVAVLHKLSYDNALKQMKALKWDNNTIKNVSDIVGQLNIKIEKTDYFIRKFVSNFGIENAKTFLFFKEKLDNENYEVLFNEIDLITKNNYATIVKELDIDGNDLKELGIQNGKEIGQILKFLLEKVLIDPSLNKKSILTEMIGEYNEN